MPGSVLIVDDHPGFHAQARALTELKHVIEELRELARGIQPAILTEEGLPGGRGITRPISPRPPVHVIADFEAVAYFVVSESLANVAKYAHASHARVEL